jgi:tryptophanyl-tRNA synthetase
MPEPFIGKKGAKITSLQDPTSKMSKSDPNPKASVSVLDEPNVIMKKFKSAVTDSEACVRYADGKDGINNLMTIYSCCTGKSYEEIENEFAGKGYGDFKVAVGEAVIEELRPLQENYKRIIADTAYVNECMAKGAERASRLAQRTLDKCMKKIGFKQI